MPVSSAMRDMVTERRPCSATSWAVASITASRTSRRCSSIVSVHSLGTAEAYQTTVLRHYVLTETECLDKTSWKPRGGGTATKERHGLTTLTPRHRRRRCLTLPERRRSQHALGALRRRGGRGSRLRPGRRLAPHRCDRAG